MNPGPARTRDISQNYFKGLLVTGMVLAHSLQLLTVPEGIFSAFSAYINLITFSGFMFSFGYVYQIAYAHKETGFFFALNKMEATLFAFYFSAFAWELFVNHRMSSGIAANTLLILNVPPYSEFLLSFFLATGLYFLFKKQIAFITSNWRYTLIFLALVFVISLIPFEHLFGETYFGHYMSLFLGSHKPYFPVLQYSSLFIAGIWFQKNSIGFSLKILIISISGTLIFAGYLLYFKGVPRFPPSPFRITGTFLFLYIYYIISKRLKANYLADWLSIAGENSLVYLVLSNVLLFAAKDVLQMDTATSMAYCLMILLFITYLISVTRKYVPART